MSSHTTDLAVYAKSSSSSSVSHRSTVGVLLPILDGREVKVQLSLSDYHNVERSESE